MPIRENLNAGTGPVRYVDPVPTESLCLTGETDFESIVGVFTGFSGDIPDGSLSGPPADF
jgi:hypothetical protein